MSTSHHTTHHTSLDTTAANRQARRATRRRKIRRNGSALFVGSVVALTASPALALLMDQDKVTDNSALSDGEAPTGIDAPGGLDLLGIEVPLPDADPDGDPTALIPDDPSTLLDGLELPDPESLPPIDPTTIDPSDLDGPIALLGEIIAVPESDPTLLELPSIDDIGVAINGNSIVITVPASLGGVDLALLDLGGAPVALPQLVDDGESLVATVAVPAGLYELVIDGTTTIPVLVDEAIASLTTTLG